MPPKKPKKGWGSPGCRRCPVAHDTLPAPPLACPKTGAHPTSPWPSSHLPPASSSSSSSELSPSPARGHRQRRASKWSVPGHPGTEGPWCKETPAAAGPGASPQKGKQAGGATSQLPGPALLTFSRPTPPRSCLRFRPRAAGPAKKTPGLALPGARGWDGVGWGGLGWDGSEGLALLPPGPLAWGRSQPQLSTSDPSIPLIASPAPHRGRSSSAPRSRCWHLHPVLLESVERAPGT